MQVEVTDLYNKEVFTHKGIYLGRVMEILIDINKNLIYEMILSETNPNLIDESRNIGIPFRWIQSISEVIVLKYFPGKVHIKPRMFRSRRKRRKMRVIKQRWGFHGTQRTPWKGRSGRKVKKIDNNQQ